MDAGVCLTGRHPAERLGDRREGIHEIHRAADQRSARRRRILILTERPREEAQHEVVHRVSDIHHPRGPRVADVDLAGGSRRLAHDRVARDRMCSREAGPVPGEREVLVADGDEAAVVGALGVGRGPLALLDDGVDRPMGAQQVDDGDQTGKPGEIAPHLRRGRADEDGSFAELRAQMGEAVADAAVEVPNGRVILGAGEESVTVGGPLHVRRCLESCAIGDLHPLWPLEEHEVVEGRQIEGREREDDARGMVAGWNRKVRALELRREAD
jgi:hypothetical protein